ncbi:suppressor of fused domain protein [Metabacillus malikii]|uniref:Suppressor of fused-like domain-containing protein n=1 Tax=Metabacillus malikii TaxID=1504265 RepID=A0ABT9ZA45_9BACI|nr:suppressor of fused domain protein [Metabacillus malikii]MDQ0229111.1 hypothetical protein [Metabacillus malikii]
MNVEEYNNRAKIEEDWAPGWEAIDEAFEQLYPNQTPAHFGTNLHARAVFGGDQYLDGYSIYASPNGYKHIVSYGLTELYTNEEAFGGEWSGWGYEMTFKLSEESNEECMWALDMFANLARYTNTQKRYFEPLQFIGGNGTSIKLGSDSKITALLIVNDTEAKAMNTVHGKVDFLQLVGITERELDVLKQDRTQAAVLVEKMKRDNPFLVTDMSRTCSFL